MMERGGANAMDRISELPQFIIHQILSYLFTKEAARTSVLSKTWLQAWSTSPILMLNEFYFSKHDFFSFVNNTLLRYRTHNLRIHKIDIVQHTVDHAPAYHLLDQSIGTSLDHGVKRLHINTALSYTLPQTMFSTSAKALTNLSVYGCKFPQNLATNIAICFPFLKKLDIDSAYMDDGMLQKLLSSCPSVEKVVFCRVSGFKKFLVRNLGQLKILDIHSGNKVEVHIEDAPSLHFFRYCGYFELPCYLQVGSPQNLKHLVLNTLNTITNNFLNELITKFPLLEDLNILSCNGLERINVSGRSLKHLVLSYCNNLVEANVDAPNLLRLEYKGYRAMSLSLVNTPDELMTDIYITYLGFGWPNITWFHQLRENLKSVSRANVSLYISLRGVQFLTDMDLIANPLPLEDFMSEINQSSTVFDAFVETFFSIYRPTIISTLKFLYPDKFDFIIFLGNELIMATRNSNCCISNQETKCWRHFLKDMKVEVYENSQNAWQPLPWETLLVQNRFLDEEIRFSLKWNANLD